MTDRDPTKTIPRSVRDSFRVARAIFTVRETTAVDAFDDEIVDALCAEAIAKGEAEPTLLVVERIAGRTRYRREV
jgi:hypothetical protein